VGFTRYFQCAEKKLKKNNQIKDLKQHYLEQHQNLKKLFITRIKKRIVQKIYRNRHELNSGHQGVVD
jgi:hypothetical protein